MASVMAAGSGIGMIIGRMAVGDGTLDMALLAGAGVGWLAGYLIMRLTAPATLQGMRLQHQWREERRQIRRQAAGSPGRDDGQINAN